MFGRWTVTGGSGSADESGGVATLDSATITDTDPGDVFGDLDVSVTVANAASPGGDSAAWLWWHQSGADAVGFRIAPNGWRLVRVDGGVETELDSGTTSIGSSARRVRFRQVGDTVWIYVGSSLVTSVGGLPASSGTIGLEARNSTVTFDDVLVYSF